MSHYHRVLGVSTSASKSEIKSAYRNLAKKLHPDRNSSPNADEEFSSIQEAYDFLMEAPVYQKKAEQSTRTKTKTENQTKSSYQTAQERVRVARERLKFQEERENAINERYFQSLIHGPKGRFVRIGAIICLIVTTAFLLDTVLPHHQIPDKIDYVSNSYGEGRMRPGEQVIYTQGGEAMELELVAYSWGDAQLDIQIEKTWFFHFPVAVTQDNSNILYAFPIFREFWQKPPIPLICFAPPIFLLFYKKRTATFTALFMSSIYVFIPLTLLFLLGHFRWFHLLTLGFF